MDSSIVQEVSFGQGIALRHTRFPIKGGWFEKKRDVAQRGIQTKQNLSSRS